jgi:hypothetical protein
MSAIRKFCTKAALIQDSKLVSIGDPEDIATLYEDVNLRAAEPRIKVQNEQQLGARHEGTAEATTKKVETYNPKTGKAQNAFAPDEKIGVRIHFTAHDDLHNPSVGFIFQDQADITVFATHNVDRGVKTKDIKKGEGIVLETVVDNIFTDGEYTITCAIESEDFQTMYDRVEYAHTFVIGGHHLAHAKVHPHQDMHISYIKEKS